MKIQALRNELELPYGGKEERDSVFRVIFEHVTGRDMRLSTVMGYEPTVTEESCIRDAIKRAMTGEPVQYIVGKWSFMGNEFVVNKDVLIPRADTEILCEKAIEFISDKKGARVLDLCCGSGCIGISIAVVARDCFVECCDISRGALEVTRRNAELNGVDVKVTESDLLNNCGEYQLIVSNPPYIPTGVIEGLETNVRDHEPMLALDGGADGLDFYRRIAEDAVHHLVVGGGLFLEIGYDQATAVTNILAQQGYGDITVIKDYSGNDRVVTSIRKEQ